MRMYRAKKKQKLEGAKSDKIPKCKKHQCISLKRKAESSKKEKAVQRTKQTGGLE